MLKQNQPFGIIVLTLLWITLDISGLGMGVAIAKNLTVSLSYKFLFGILGEIYFLIVLPLINVIVGLLWISWYQKVRFSLSKRRELIESSSQTLMKECAKAEQALKESEERFKGIFEQAAVGMVLMTIEGHFFRVNQKFCDILGYNRLELLQITFEKVILSNHSSEYQKFLQNLIQEKINVLAQETQVCHKMGQAVWVRMTLSVVCDRNTQQPKYFLGVFEDIHRRKEAETALRDSEEKFRQLTENVQDVFWLYDPQKQKLLYLNPAYEKVWGKPVEEAYKYPLSWLKSIHPQDYSYVKSSITDTDVDQKTVKEFRIIHPDGSIRWICDRAFPIFNDQGQVTRIAGITTDITERKQAEKALKEQQYLIQKIADSTPNILYIYDLIENQNVYANQEIANLLGFSIQEIEAMGNSLFATLMHPEDLARLSDYFKQFNAVQDGDILEIEYRIKDIHNEWHWFVSRDTIFSRNSEGKPQQVLGTASDITERKIVESALLKANLQFKEKVNELEVRNAEMFRLGEMNEFLQICSSVKEASLNIAQYIDPMFPDCWGSLYLMNDEKQSLEKVSEWGLEHHQEKDTQQENWVDSHLTDILCTGKPFSDQGYGLLYLPMIALGETLGMLCLQSQNQRGLTVAQSYFARTVAEHLALAIANLELRENLRNQSIRDPLTGLFNRRYMIETLEQEIERADRGQHSVGLILLDVDHFKQFNDNFGHNAGDRVLRVLSGFLKRNIRVSDTVCRYGGEELLLILPEATVADSYQRAEQIRQRVERLQVKQHGQPLGTVTVSLGIAAFPEHGETGEELIQHADEALYQAKHKGRNCTMVYGV